MGDLGDRTGKDDGQVGHRHVQDLRRVPSRFMIGRARGHAHRRHDHRGRQIDDHRVSHGALEPRPHPFAPKYWATTTDTPLVSPITSASTQKTVELVAPGRPGRPR